jgi:hypothetical protein
MVRWPQTRTAPRNSQASLDGDLRSKAAASRVTYWPIEVSWCDDVMAGSAPVWWLVLPVHLIAPSDIFRNSPKLKVDLGLRVVSRPIWSQCRNQTAEHGALFVRGTDRPAAKARNVYGARSSLLELRPADAEPPRWRQVLDYPGSQAPSGSPRRPARAQVGHSWYGFAPQTWICGATGDTVYCYFIVSAVSGNLICAEVFSHAPDAGLRRCSLAYTLLRKGSRSL